MTIPEFFNKGYYINLDKRVDRNNQFINEMSNENLLEFFERHSGHVPSFEDIDNNNPSDVYYRKLGGCAQSHKEIIQKANDLDLDNVLILEDDATFYNNGDIPAIDIINSGLDTLSKIKDWDIVYLGGVIVNPEVKKVDKNLIQVNTMLSSHAWGINKKAYKYFLNFIPNLDSNSTKFGPMDSSIGNHLSIKKFLIYPLAMYQREGITSDVNIDPNANLNPNLDTYIIPWLNNYNNITFI